MRFYKESSNVSRCLQTRQLKENDGNARHIFCDEKAYIPETDGIAKI